MRPFQAGGGSRLIAGTAFFLSRLSATPVPPPDTLPGHGASPTRSRGKSAAAGKPTAQKPVAPTKPRRTQPSRKTKDSGVGASQPSPTADDEQQGGDGEGPAQDNTPLVNEPPAQQAVSSRRRRVRQDPAGSDDDGNGSVQASEHGTDDDYVGLHTDKYRSRIF